MTGNEIPGRPSLGSWLSYGLGSENKDLPAFVVMTPRSWTAGNGQALFTALWGSGFLPSKYQRRRPARQRRPGPVPVEPARRRRSDDRRAMLDALGRAQPAATSTQFGDPETQTRIAQYEMAFRMQTQRAGADRPVASEPQATLDLYGPDVHEARHVRRTAACWPAGWSSAASVRADLPPRLGPARQPARATCRNQCKDIDQADRRACSTT